MPEIDNRSDISGSRHVPRRYASRLLGSVALPATLIAALGGTAQAGQLTAAAFQAYNPSSAASIQPGPFALYTVGVNTLHPTQLNEGLTEVGKKAAGFDLLAPSQLQANLLTAIEPVIIGPGGALYLTDGHHTFTALLDSVYGASNPTVFVNVIANYSNLTTAQFFTMLQAQNFLLPLDNGVPQTVNPATGAPIPTALTSLTQDVYRGLEYSILKNKSSILFPTTSNITGAIGASTAGLDKMTGYYADFLEAAAYRNANGGLGLPTLSPGDIALATQWNLKGTSTTTLPNVTGTVTAAQLPGFILSNSITLSSTISNATLANGALDGNGTFTGITTINAGTVANPITIGTPNTGFIMEVGADKGFSVTLSGSNTYTGGTSLLAGTLIIANDTALGAAPTGAAIDPANVKTSVQAANGIVFNSLTEGNAILTIGTVAGGGTATFTTSRPIAVAGETATINLNGYVATFNGSLASFGSGGTGLGNATGVSDITFDDNSSNKGVAILAAASPNFYGNIIVGNSNNPTVRVMSDAALGATTGSAATLGQVELNGGTLQAGASFAAPERNLFLGGGSSFDVNGFTTSWGTMTDVQRTLAILNSNTTTAGAVTFNNLNVGATATLQLAGGAAGETVTLTNGIVRSGAATLIIQPTSSTSLGTTTEKLMSGTGTASLVNTGGTPIAQAWIVTNNGAASSAGPYDFVTYGANGYVAATYNASTLGNAPTQVVGLVANATASGNLAAFALNTKGFNIALGGNTLTLGDGTNPAGLILGKNTAITGGTLAFGGSEGVVWLGGSGATISATISGSSGLTFAGSGAVTVSTASTMAGSINIDSGSVTLSGANVFSSALGGITLANTKTKPAPATLAITASNMLTTLNSVGSNSKITLSNGAALTLGDTTNNLSSTINSPLTETGTAVSGALTLNGSGLFDFSAAGKNSLGLLAGSSVIVNNSARFRVVANQFASAFQVVLNGTSQLQFAQNGGGVFANNVTGTGALRIVGGTVQITGTSNSYAGGTFVETGSVLDITTANVSSGNANITAAGGMVLFDQATTGTYTGVISDGLEMGTGPLLSGSLDKDDSSGGNGGNVTLSQAQTYTGATTVEAGTLTLGAVNTVATSSGVDLGRVGGGATATLALGANNQIQALTSEAGNTTSVTLGSYTLTINTAAATYATFGGVISGTGGLTITGAGTEVLTGANTFIGTTAVNSGILLLSGGSLTGPVNVGALGTFGGVGSAGATTVSGVIGAGTATSPYGTLTVNGALTFTPTGTLVVSTNGTSASLIAATGTANLTGSVAVVNSSNAAAYALIGKTVPIVTAGTIAGTFSGATLSIANGGSSVVPTLTYSGTQVILGYAPNTVNSMLPTGSTPNNLAAAQGINAVLATGNAPTAFVNLFNLSPAALRDFTSRVSGEGLSNLHVGVGQAVLAFSGAIGGQMGGGTGAFAETGSTTRMMVASVDPTFVPLPGADKAWGVWISGFGQWENVGAMGGGHASSSTIGGGAIGADYAITPDTRIGMSFGYGTASSTTAGLNDQASQNFGQFAVYGAHTAGAWYLSGLIGTGLTTGTERRDVSVPGTPGSVSGNIAGNMLIVGAETGQHFKLTDSLIATPFIGMTFAHLHNNAITETGSPFALRVAAVGTNSARGSVGGRIGWNWRVGGVPVDTEASVAWGHEFADIRVPSTANFVGTPSSTFTAYGSATARDVAEVGLAVNAKLTASVSTYVRYEGAFGSNDTANTVRGGVRWVW